MNTVKHRLVLFLLLLNVTNVFAQLPFIRSTYKAAYVPVSNGAILSSATGDDSKQSIPIGFSFNYLGTNYTEIVLSTNGFASFNAASATSSLNDNLYSKNSSPFTLAPWWDDLRADSIFFERKGSLLNQTFIIQWTNAHSFSTATQGLNFQIILHEGTNIIEFAYGNLVAGTASLNESASIGINGTGGAGNYLDAITGSSFTGNGMLTAAANWPSNNFRFTPGAPVPISGGTYTVGLGGNYTSLSEAVADVNHRGVSGAVELSLIDQNYDDSPANGDNCFPILLGPVAGTSIANTVTIKSLLGKASISSNGSKNGNCFNATSNVIRNANEPIFALVGANFIRIDGLEFKANNDVDIALNVINSSPTLGSSNNILSNISALMLFASAAPSATLTQGIVQKAVTTPTALSGSNSNNKYFNISVVGAQLAGFVLEGNATFPDSDCALGSTIPSKFNTIRNSAVSNGISGLNLAGVKLLNQRNVEVYQTHISEVSNINKSTLPTSIDGISSTALSGSCNIYNNVIRELFADESAALMSGITVDLANNGNHTINLYNNMIHSLNGISVNKIAGISTRNGNKFSIVNVDFNTVEINSKIALSSTCLQSTTITGPKINVRNNIFSNNSPTIVGQSIFESPSNTAIGNIGSVSDYNNFFLGSIEGGIVQTLNFDQWKAGSHQDSNSFTFNPLLSIDEFGFIRTGSKNLINKGRSASSPWVTKDIDNEFRLDRQDIGADEINSLLPDVGVDALVTPVVNGSHSATEQVTVSLKNYSALPHDFSKDSVVVIMNISGTIVKTLAFTIKNNSINGNKPLEPGSKINIPMGKFDMKAFGPYTFNAFSRMIKDFDTSNNAMTTFTIFLSPLGNTSVVGSDGTTLLDSNSVHIRKTPNYITYQAKVGGVDANVPANTKVNLKFTIQQNSALGPIVYEETQFANTNRDGLVSLRIGNGKVTQGKFSLIDWSTGQYFLRTKVDVAGGTNFVLLSVNQISSVPYVFYADETKTMNYSGVKHAPNLDSLQNVLVKIKGENISLKQKIDSLAQANKGHFVGEHFGGGIVFYVYDNGQHGLIAASSDLGVPIRWFGGSKTNTGATLSKVLGGLQNTQLIVNNQLGVDGNPFAASQCLDFIQSVDGIFYNDWYLPSKDELNLMFQKRNIIGGFTSDKYWSSTEASLGTAFSQSFVDGVAGSDAKTALLKIRPIRSF